MKSITWEEPINCFRRLLRASSADSGFAESELASFPLEVASVADAFLRTLTACVIFATSSAPSIVVKNFHHSRLQMKVRRLRCMRKIGQFEPRLRHDRMRDQVKKRQGFRIV